VNKRDRKYAMFERLRTVFGISEADAVQLRRIQMTLNRWGELECGIDGVGIERDDKTGKPYLTWESHSNTGKRGRRLIPDREAGALKRLAKIMERYPMARAYHQTDPRGVSLYIVLASDIPAGEDIDAYYTRGVAVYE
jgi:hypothetical protein